MQLQSIMKNWSVLSVLLGVLTWNNSQARECSYFLNEGNASAELPKTSATKTSPTLFGGFSLERFHGPNGRQLNVSTVFIESSILKERFNSNQLALFALRNHLFMQLQKRSFSYADIEELFDVNAELISIYLTHINFRDLPLSGAELIRLNQIAESHEIILKAYLASKSKDRAQARRLGPVYTTKQVDLRWRQELLRVAHRQAEALVSSYRSLNFN